MALDLWDTLYSVECWDDESERKWNKVVVAYFNATSRHLAAFRGASHRTEIRIRDLGKRGYYKGDVGLDVRIILKRVLEI
jgi:hypothetical protein